MKTLILSTTRPRISLPEVKAGWPLARLHDNQLPGLHGPGDDLAHGGNSPHQNQQLLVGDVVQGRLCVCTQDHLDNDCVQKCFNYKSHPAQYDINNTWQWGWRYRLSTGGKKINRGISWNWHFFPRVNNLYHLPCCSCFIIPNKTVTCKKNLKNKYEGCSINNETVLITFWFASNWH